MLRFGHRRASSWAPVLRGLPLVVVHSGGAAAAPDPLDNRIQRARRPVSPSPSDSARAAMPKPPDDAL
eukprot:15483907-Alexandrium_andersonii.AAC.1